MVDLDIIRMDFGGISATLLLHSDGRHELTAPTDERGKRFVAHHLVALGWCQEWLGPGGGSKRVWRAPKCAGGKESNKTYTEESA